MSKEILNQTLTGLREALDNLRDLKNGNMEDDRQLIADKLNNLVVGLMDAGAKIEKPVEAKAEEITPQGTQEVANPITEIHQNAAENAQIAPEAPVAETGSEKSSAQKPQAAKSDEKATTASKSTGKAAASKK